MGSDGSDELAAGGSTEAFEATTSPTPDVIPTLVLEPKPKKDKTKKEKKSKAGKPAKADKPAKHNHQEPDAPPSRIVIQYVAPLIDDGRYPVKRLAGDGVAVSADVFRDGHDQLAAQVEYRRAGQSEWSAEPLTAIDAIWDGVRWAGTFGVAEAGDWEYRIAAWTDRFSTWLDEFSRKLGAGQHDLGGEIAEGHELLERTLERCKSNATRTAEETGGEAPGRKPASGSQAAPAPTPEPDGLTVTPAAKAEFDFQILTRATTALADPELGLEAKFDTVNDAHLREAAGRWQPREGYTSSATFNLQVERERAGFSSWYELFPRSWGGFQGVTKQLPKLAALGFDVLYLPPIHPIGLTNRKGRDNATLAATGDPGSPWSIGDRSGGHAAIHAELGTEQDFRKLTAAANRVGIEIALDFAINCSADHPWLTEHPEWFHRRPDGTLKYAENPPKRYQDIYNVNWDTPQWRELWQALYEVVEHWIDCGVSVFRVDNPHTKPWAFWQWLIAEVQKTHPEVIFLAEAFTRRAMMRQLAKIGFTQSYTYFTWKNTRQELTEYVTELTTSGEQDYFRPNFFVNTPDILHAYLQHGGRPAFEARAVLAATMSPSWGVYSGFEKIENVPVAPGSEEYLHSEKYEVKERALDGELLGLIGKLNEARRANRALHRFANITFLETENDSLIAYLKRPAAGSSPSGAGTSPAVGSSAGAENTVITVVSLDPHSEQQGVVVIPQDAGLPSGFAAHDLLTDERFDWHTGRNFVAFKPGVRQAHVLRVEN